MLRLLTLAACRRMPWKNGAGSTTEIATYPDGAGLEAFVWRVSVAEVARDGPFSTFPGIDRTLVLLDGAGMRLHGSAGDAIDAMTLAPIVFPGEAELHCTLRGGPVRDFNLMVRRAAATGSVNVIRGAACVVPPADVHVCHVVTGDVDFAITGGTSGSLACGDSLVLTEARATAGALAFHPRTTGAVAVLAAIHERSALS